MVHYDTKPDEKPLGQVHRKRNVGDALAPFKIIFSEEGGVMVVMFTGG